MSGRGIRPTRSTRVGTQYFEVDKKYRIIKSIGSGAYGVVVSAEDTESGKKVAIKKIPDAFADLVDAKRILREIKLMAHFRHENVSSLADMGVPEGISAWKDIYLMTPLMDTDMHKVIYSRQKLTDEHVQYFVYQILRALKYVHSAGVIHRDLKPANILINSNCDLRITDWGLARVLTDKKETLTEYVVTRWYRAPEIMLACKYYTEAVDVWSVGCILAELLGAKPLFPGDDYKHQLTLIAKKIGKPTDSDLAFIEEPRAVEFMRALPDRAKVDWRALFPDSNEKALDLLDRMLTFHPDKRITIDEALRHPYMASLHSPDDEPVAKSRFHFSFEADELNEEGLKRHMLEEVYSFHPEARGMVGR
jgi:serine/threonine protein kinase